MQVGDLIRYRARHNDHRDTNGNTYLGIITSLEPVTMPDRCHVVWFGCDNEGWWSRKNLEVVSGGR